MNKRWTTPLLILLVALTPFIRGDGPKTKGNTPFAAANELYRQGNYKEAVKAYEKLLQSEKNTAVAYNLGNAYFKVFQLEPNRASGYLGRAILCYEKVLRASPRDVDALANLKYARSLTIDKFDSGKDESGAYGLLLRLYSFPNTWELEIAMTLSIWFLVVVLVLKRHARREILSELLFWVLFIVLPLTLFVTSWTGMRAWEDELLNEGVILIDKVNANGAPQEDATHVFTLHEGTKVNIRRTSKGWMQISLPNGFSGWVREEALGPIN